MTEPRAFVKKNKEIRLEEKRWFAVQSITKPFGYLFLKEGYGIESTEWRGEKRAIGSFLSF